MFAHTNLITYESLYSSSYLLNENLFYDKLWGPSQRVVTLFQEQDIFYFSLQLKNHLAKPSNVSLISTISFKCPGESYLQIGFSIGTCEVTRHQSGSILHKPQPGTKCSVH